jgi:4-carboxymuconolactone decarboxylase
MRVRPIKLTLASATAAFLLLLTRASANEPPKITIARSGSQPSRQGPSQHFTGSVRVDPLFPARDPSRVSGAYVTFEPGAHTAWHIHPLGQTLVVTAGTGWIQQLCSTSRNAPPSPSPST